jgi:hypothetical protein
MVNRPKPAHAAAALALALGMSASAQNPLTAIGDAAQLPSSVPHLERLNDMTLDELGLCDANFTSHVNASVPSFVRDNVSLTRVVSASEIIARLPDETREYLERESGINLAEVGTFNVNYAGIDPVPSDRLILDLGVSTRANNVVTELDGVRRNRFASETARLEIEGVHARAIADTLEAVCADTRFGDLRSITGDQYLDVLRAAARGFEALYGENSSLREEIRRLEASIDIRSAPDAQMPAPDAQPQAAEPRSSVPVPEPRVPERGYAAPLPGAVPPSEPALRTPELIPEPRDAPTVPALSEPVREDASSLESRIGLDIAYFEPGVPVAFETFAGAYTAQLAADGSRLVIDAYDGRRSEIAIDGAVRLAYAVDPVDGLDNAHLAQVYANPHGWRFDVLAVTQDPTLVALREGPHDATETFTTQDRWTTEALPHSFEGYTAPDGWARTVDGYAPVNVANVTGEIGRSIRLRTEE